VCVGVCMIAGVYLYVWTPCVFALGEICVSLMHEYMYLVMYVCMYVYICIHMFVFFCACACLCVYMYVC